MDDLSGKTLLKNYFLKKKLPSGQVADVYYAWDKKRSAEVAIKVLHRDRSYDLSIKQFFTSEATLMAKLDHPHIVRFYEFCDDGQYAFFVMDWIDGQDLKEVIDSRQAPFSMDEVLNIFNPISSALNFAHSQNVIHCDIKPANIMIEKTGKILLSDFGISRRVSQKNAGGTPPYMAPEQFEGRRLTPQTDIYALGIMLFELFSGGQVPFRGETQKGSLPTPTTLWDRIYWEVMNLPYPGIVEFNANISPQVEEIVRKALQKDPAQRFSSALALYRALEQAARGYSTIPRQHETGLSARSQPTVQSSLGNAQRYEKQPTPNSWLRANLVSQLPEFYRGPYLVCLAGELRNRMLLLPGSFIAIGRSSQSDLQLQDRSISRKHASLIINRDGVFIRDENSSLGTWVNGMPVQMARLLPQDIIQIGYSDKFEMNFI